MNRGSSVAPRSVTRLARLFNEAPIHESGKCEARATLRTADLGLQ